MHRGRIIQPTAVAIVDELELMGVSDASDEQAVAKVIDMAGGDFGVLQDAFVERVHRMTEGTTNPGAVILDDWALWRIAEAQELV